jgi:hypothetical protein
MSATPFSLIKSQSSPLLANETQNSNMSAPTKSILIIGAAGTMGMQCLRQLSKDSSTVRQVHVLCRDANSLPDSLKQTCESVLVGDAKNPVYIERAIQASRASLVILVLGDDAQKSASRDRTRAALGMVLRKPKYHKVKAIAMSSQRTEVMWYESRQPPPVVASSKSSDKKPVVNNKNADKKLVVKPREHRPKKVTTARRAQRVEV